MLPEQTSLPFRPVTHRSWETGGSATPLEQPGVPSGSVRHPSLDRNEPGASGLKGVSPVVSTPQTLTSWYHSAERKSDPQECRGAAAAGKAETTNSNTTRHRAVRRVDCETMEPPPDGGAAWAGHHWPTRASLGPGYEHSTRGFVRRDGPCCGRGSREKSTGRNRGAVSSESAAEVDFPRHRRTSGCFASRLWKTHLGKAPGAGPLRETDLSARRVCT